MQNISINHVSWTDCLTLFKFLCFLIQWTLIITNSSGPKKLLCYNEIRLSGLQKQWNTEYRENLNFLTRKVFCFNKFVISVFFIKRVHCIVRSLNQTIFSEDYFCAFLSCLSVMLWLYQNLRQSICCGCSALGGPSE